MWGWIIYKAFFCNVIPFHPASTILEIQKNAPPLAHSQTHSDDVIVRTKKDSENHQNDLKDDEKMIPPLDFMVRTEPNIEHHEDNKTKKIIKENSHKAKHNISLIGNKSCLTLAIQTEHTKASLPYQLTKKHPIPHG
ncbi:hypothetical protein O181_128657 [Austropuccinia psidii MF-1]|uniref:Uncharacterized protein n=1 Tax=Austropuccinia psidii MF-1 TaxID=1389203 RepID=A0A9Q3KXQ8_9BASI|nr:hypothetical protein [Austropuccinia psidii MF-1]